MVLAFSIYLSARQMKCSIVAVLKNFSRSFDEMYIFSCCFELSARGKLLANQIQLLIYVFLKKWLIN